MNSTTHATSLTSAGLHRWRAEIQMFYEQTAVELNRIVSAIDDYKQSTTQAVVSEPVARQQAELRDTILSQSSYAVPLSQRSMSLSREFSTSAADVAEIEPIDRAAPVLDTAPMPLARAANSPTISHITAVWPQPGTAAIKTDRVADRALDRENVPLSTSEATPQDRLSLLKQQIAAKLSASPRDDQKTEEPRS